MKRILMAVVVVSVLAPGLHAQTAPDADELTRLLKEFLAGASRNDAAVHDRFWAEELVYTGSAGRRRGKADVLRDVRQAPAPKPGDPATAYTAEDIRIQQYGDTAIVAFQLVGTTTGGAEAGVANFLNTGTFLKRGGRWQVVAWQATRMAAPAEARQQNSASKEDTIKAVAGLEEELTTALGRCDVAVLDRLWDNQLAFVFPDGSRASKSERITGLKGCTPGSPASVNESVAVSAYGDTAVATVLSKWTGTAEGKPFASRFRATHVWVKGPDRWTLVAAHLSQLKE